MCLVSIPLNSACGFKLWYWAYFLMIYWLLPSPLLNRTNFRLVDLPDGSLNPSNGSTSVLSKSRRICSQIILPRWNDDLTFESDFPPQIITHIGICSSQSGSPLITMYLLFDIKNIHYEYAHYVIRLFPNRALPDGQWTFQDAV